MAEETEYPVNCEEDEDQISPDGILRDLFAAAALAGYLANATHGFGATWDDTAADCYHLADAMLKARNA